MADTASHPASGFPAFRFSLIREAALDALRPVDTPGDALLLLLTWDTGQGDNLTLPDAVLRSKDTRRFLIVAVNEAARHLFSRDILGETLDRVNRDLDRALRSALNEQRLPVEKQRMILHGLPFRISLRQFTVEGHRFIGIALAAQQTNAVKRNVEMEDEASILAYETDDERTLARRLALRALYEIDASKHAPETALQSQLRLVRELPRTARYTTLLVTGVLKYRSALDETLQRYAPEFPIEQIALIDRNVLRIAVFEFAVDGRVPVGAAIDEAVELAKIFGADGAGAFVNGVLGSLANDEPAISALRALSQAHDLAADGDGIPG
ncbi:MAG: transcription antitermination factor NusB [Anaerolinea sp.]|nr:transcription antitermination factor NusB [Anaerolinea sp.]